MGKTSRSGRTVARVGRAVALLSVGRCVVASFVYFTLCWTFVRSGSHSSRATSPESSVDDSVSVSCSTRVVVSVTLIVPRCMRVCVCGQELFVFWIDSDLISRDIWLDFCIARDGRHKTSRANVQRAAYPSANVSKPLRMCDLSVCVCAVCVCRDVNKTGSWDSAGLALALCLCLQLKKRHVAAPAEAEAAQPATQRQQHYLHATRGGSSSQQQQVFVCLTVI